MQRCWPIFAVLLLLGCARDQVESEVTVRKLVSISEAAAVDLPGQHNVARADTVTLWLGPGLARRDAQAGTFLVDSHRGLLTHVNHDNRTWTRESAALVRRQLAALATDTLKHAGDPRLHQLKRLLEVSARVTDTGEEATIDGYQCRRWIVEQSFGDQTTTSELWLTREIDADYSLMLQTTQPALAALPGGEAATQELRKLAGVVVRSSGVLRVLGRKTTTSTRLISAETTSVPLSLFSPPADYESTQAGAE